MKRMPALTGYFYLLIFSLFLGICSFSLLADGMFMDGLIYASIARNMADGLGSFWYPHLSDTLYPAFHEHPPLAFWIQSLWFRTFGDSIYVERLYSLFTFILTGFIMTRIWVRLTKDELTAWLPLIFWITIPLVSWSCSNNMLESTLMVFTCTSVLLYLYSLETKRFPFLCLCGLILFLGLLTKGFVALFVWSFPFWLWLLTRKFSFRHMITDTVVIILSTSIPLLVILIFSTEAQESLNSYFFRQVVESLTSAKTVDSRFFVLQRMLTELLIPIGLSLLIWITFGLTKRRYHGKSDMRLSLAFFLIGLSGVLPIMISWKQSGFYMIPAFPFIAVALALLVSPFLQPVLSGTDKGHPGFRWIKWISILAGVGAVTLSILQIGRIGRDQEKIRMVYRYVSIIPHHTTIGIYPEMFEDWSLHGYFIRTANISLTPDVSKPFTFYLIRKEYLPYDTIRQTLDSLDQSGNYLLYRKKF